MKAEIEYTRMTIDVPSSMHRLIKAQASLQNMSIKNFVIKAIENDVGKEMFSDNIPNAKTVAVIRDSIKNHHKLKRFDNVSDFMKYLNGPEKKPVKKPLKKPRKK